MPPNLTGARQCRAGSPIARTVPKGIAPMPILRDCDSEAPERKRRAVWLALPLLLVLLLPTGMLGWTYSWPVVLASPNHGMCLYWWSIAAETTFGGVGDPDVILPPARALSPSVVRFRLLQLPRGSFIVDQGGGLGD